MIKKDSEHQEVIVRHVYCDDCGVEIKREMQCSVAKCEICGKDLCDECIGHEVDTGGDYREVYCKSCWEIGTKNRLEIKQLENKIELLYNQWHEKCKNHNETTSFELRYCIDYNEFHYVCKKCNADYSKKSYKYCPNCGRKIV